MEKQQIENFFILITFIIFSLFLYGCKEKYKTIDSYISTYSVEFVYSGDKNSICDILRKLRKYKPTYYIENKKIFIRFGSFHCINKAEIEAYALYKTSLIPKNYKIITPKDYPVYKIAYPKKEMKKVNKKNAKKQKHPLPKKEIYKKHLSKQVHTKTIRFKEKKKTYIKHSKKKLNRKIKLRKFAVKFAKSYLGVKYFWGGESLESGFDCSGLTWSVYRMLGYNIPRVSYRQSKYGKLVRNIYRLKPGDLIFFDTDGDNKVNHVGIYIGNYVFIHASKKYHKIKKEKILPWKKYFVCGRSIIN